MSEVLIPHLGALNSWFSAYTSYISEAIIVLLLHNMYLTHKKASAVEKLAL